MYMSMYTIDALGACWSYWVLLDCLHVLAPCPKVPSVWSWHFGTKWEPPSHYVTLYHWWLASPLHILTAYRLHQAQEQRDITKLCNFSKCQLYDNSNNINIYIRIYIYIDMYVSILRIPELTPAITKPGKSVLCVVSCYIGRWQWIERCQHLSLRLAALYGSANVKGIQSLILNKIKQHITIQCTDHLLQLAKSSTLYIFR